MADTEHLKIILDDNDIVINESGDVKIDKVERSKMLFEIHAEASK
jgi:hypothetical protein